MIVELSLAAGAVMALMSKKPVPKPVPKPAVKPIPKPAAKPVPPLVAAALKPSVKPPQVLPKVMPAKAFTFGAQKPCPPGQSLQPSSRQLNAPLVCRPTLNWTGLVKPQTLSTASRDAAFMARRSAPPTPVNGKCPTGFRFVKGVTYKCPPRAVCKPSIPDRCVVA